MTPPTVTVDSSFHLCVKDVCLCVCVREYRPTVCALALCYILSLDAALMKLLIMIYT